MALLLAACGAGVSGEVRDAASGRPVAGARVEVTTVGWGRRDGGLVWDKSFVHSTSTGAGGRFEIDVSGGVNLRAAAPGYRAIDTSLCSRSPNLIRVGGPFDGVDLGKQLRASTGREEARGWRFGAGGETVAAAEADLIVARPPTDQSTTAELRAPHRMAFVAGTGNPPAPPAGGYVESVELDLLDCGWLFVRTRGGGVAAVRTGSFGLDEPVEGGRYVMLSYGNMPAR